jgi:mRNA interferase YafQ
LNQGQGNDDSMLNPNFTNQFQRDYKRMKKRGADLEAIKAVMDRLIQELPLPSRHRDHRLSGNWHDHRDCHVKPDWVLIYRVEGAEITFVRTGTHSDLDL